MYNSDKQRRWKKYVMEKNKYFILRVKSIQKEIMWTFVKLNLPYFIIFSYNNIYFRSGHIRSGVYLGNRKVLWSKIQKNHSATWILSRRFHMVPFHSLFIICALVWIWEMSMIAFYYILMTLLFFCWTYRQPNVYGWCKKIKKKR